MASIRFLLRCVKSETPQTIYVTSRFGRNEKLMYATPLKIEPIFWDEHRQRVKASRYCQQRDSINEALDSLEAKIKEHISQSVRDGREISNKTLRDFLNLYFKKGNDSDFHNYYKVFIETLGTRQNIKRGGINVTEKTIFEYKRTFHLLECFEKDYRIKLSFDNITQDTLQQFVTFLQKRNYATNTIYKKITCVKAVMNGAVERGLTQNTKWRHFRKTSEETDAVALNEIELQKIKELDLSRFPRLERTRDLFLLGCWTGLRFSDVTRIQMENIHDNIITIIQSKTNEQVSIPIHPVFGEIWEKYGGHLPTSISNQKFNDYIKEVCKKAGIKESVLKSITKGGRKIVTKYEKWQLVSSHTARRSFATNLYRSGFPSISIMQITGHKSESAFLKYIKVSKDEHARLLAEHWEKQKKE
ncbi:MAG: tyrosine-type recombinase/integrase [Bacteroidaceae bacterium]